MGLYESPWVDAQEALKTVSGTQEMRDKVSNLLRLFCDFFFFYLPEDSWLPVIGYNVPFT